MKTLECIQIVFGMLAIGSGAIVLRGVFRRAPRCKYTVRFLEFSLLASIAGLLPLTRHLTSLQAICMLSVYCSGAVVLAWLKFRLAGNWRSVFAFFIPVVLYLNVVSLAVRLSPNLAIAVMDAHLSIYVAQLLLAAFFAVLGGLAVRKFHAEPARFSKMASPRARLIS
jgi:hypothetical protein